MSGIKRLAQHLDISIGTVSRALNGKPDVNAETRKRVLEAANSLGYVANQSGRALRQGTSNTIGFMVESSAERAAGGDNFFLEVFDGVQTALARHKLDLVVLPCSNDEDPGEYLQRIVGRRLVDAMIISATQRIDPRVEFLTRAKIPFIALGRTAVGDAHPWIDLDFEAVTRTVIGRLAARGHRRIALGLPASDVNLSYVFHDCYREELARNGLDYDPALAFRTNPSEQGGYAMAGEMLALEQRPTAILLSFELMAIGIYRRYTEAGLLPGRDLAVVGLRESPQARFLSPTLTCFRLSLRDLGISLAESLLAAMPAYAHLYPAGIVHRLWPMELVPRESDDYSV